MMLNKLPNLNNKIPLPVLKWQIPSLLFSKNSTMALNNRYSNHLHLATHHLPRMKLNLLLEYRTSKPNHKFRRQFYFNTKLLKTYSFLTYSNHNLYTKHRLDQISKRLNCPNLLNRLNCSSSLWLSPLNRYNN